MTTITDTERRPEEEPKEELALTDLDLPDERAGEVTGGRIDATGGIRGGGCDDFGCGTNHNEALALTA